MDPNDRTSAPLILVPDPTGNGLLPAAALPLHQHQPAPQMLIHHSSMMADLNANSATGQQQAIAQQQIAVQQHLAAQQQIAAQQQSIAQQQVVAQQQQLLLQHQAMMQMGNGLPFAPSQQQMSGQIVNSVPVYQWEQCTASGSVTLVPDAFVSIAQRGCGYSDRFSLSFSNFGCSSFVGDCVQAAGAGIAGPQYSQHIHNMPVSSFQPQVPSRQTPYANDVFTISVQPGQPLQGPSLGYAGQSFFGSQNAVPW